VAARARWRPAQRSVEVTSSPLLPQFGALRPIDVNLDLVDAEIRGEVEDRGPGTRALLRAGEGADDPLVLRIVDGLVGEWGANRKRTGIWFRLNVGLVDWRVCVAERLWSERMVIAERAHGGRD